MLYRLRPSETSQLARIEVNLQNRGFLKWRDQIGKLGEVALPLTDFAENFHKVRQGLRLHFDVEFVFLSYLEVEL